MSAAERIIWRYMSGEIQDFEEARRLLVALGMDRGTAGHVLLCARGLA